MHTVGVDIEITVQEATSTIPIEFGVVLVGGGRAEATLFTYSLESPFPTTDTPSLAGDLVSSILAVGSGHRGVVPSAECRSVAGQDAPERPVDQSSHPLDGAVGGLGRPEAVGRMRLAMMRSSSPMTIPERMPRLTQAA